MDVKKLIYIKAQKKNFKKKQDMIINYKIEKKNFK